MEHPVCGLGCEPLQQSGGDDRKVFAVERADRRNQSGDESPLKRNREYTDDNF
jgi:hypothetical protein